MTRCSRCPAVFTSIKAFDKHLTGTTAKRGPCPQDLTTRGLVQTANGNWAVAAPSDKLAG